MRIIYLHQYFNTPAMPGSTRSYEMAKRLVSAGHEVHMVTADTSGRRATAAKWYETAEAGIRVHWVPVPYNNHMSYRERIGAFTRFALLSARKAASLPGDVVFASSTPLTIALPAVYAGKKRGVPMVFEVRDLWPEVPIAVGAIKNPAAAWAARRLERFAYSHAARIVALSPGMKEGVAATGYPNERVTVIPNSCDLDFFTAGEEEALRTRREHEWLGERPLVIYTGALGLINGVDYFARLAKEVSGIDPEVRFLVIGEGREEGKVRATAAELGVLDQNFFMKRGLPKRDIPAWLAAADMATSFVIDLEILWANSANKFFDALAAGKPVAINHGGWQAELIKENHIGLVLDPSDIPAAAKRLVEALKDKQWLERAGKTALKMAREQFNRELMAARLEKVLRDSVTAVS